MKRNNWWTRRLSYVMDLFKPQPIKFEKKEVTIIDEILR